MSNIALYILAITVSLIMALILTPVVGHFARRYAFLGHQKIDRWHHNPTALMGGISIFITFIFSCLIFLKWVSALPFNWDLLLPVLLIFSIGLIDDLLYIKPYQRLIGQFTGAALFIYFGQVLQWTAFPWLNTTITIIIVVLITRVTNLLDNLDGLTAGVFAITATFLSVNHLINHHLVEALLLGIFGAALLGFLFYNSNPATIYLSNCGSMFVGFFLANMIVLSASDHRSLGFITVVAVPFLILFIPIFDTAFVKWLRTLSGRPAIPGNMSYLDKAIDGLHAGRTMFSFNSNRSRVLRTFRTRVSSQYFVMMSVSERRTVWILYGLAAISGLLVLFTSGFRFDTAIAAIAGSTVVVTLFGVYLLQPRIFEAWEFDQEQQLYRAMSEVVRRFITQAGAKVRSGKTESFYISEILGRLKTFAPIPVWLAQNRPTSEDISGLLASAERLSRSSSERAGILIYRDPPNVLVRMQIAEVRLRDHFALIPIPYAAIEQALPDKVTCAGLLNEYIERYLPGADLFDDRNAIGDTLSFFGRTRLLHRLEIDLLNFQSVGLFGLRKSGKTSVLLQLGFTLRQHPVVHVDLQNYGGKILFGSEIFNEILGKLSALLRESNPSYTRKFELLTTDIPAANLVVEFNRRLTESANMLYKAGYEPPILCFLDEVERILPMKGDPKEKAEEFNAVFGALRVLSQEQRKLSLLIADVHPDCNRINYWAQEGVPTNPVNNFFKEVFLEPFLAEETNTMIKDIGRLMGWEFDVETLESLHRDSGGFPFIARQLASLVCTKVRLEKSATITWAAARRYVENPFSYSGVLKDYFSFNIWDDLEKRNFAFAMAVLQVLAYNEGSINRFSELTLYEWFRSNLKKSELLDALLWLESVGLIIREEINGVDHYRIRVPLLSRWLLLNVNSEEIKQWKIQ